MLRGKRIGKARASWAMGLGLVIACLSALPADGAGPYGPEYRFCDAFDARDLRVQVYATQVRCRKAVKIQKEYWLGPDERKVVVNGTGATGYVRLKRFPGWKCSSGAGGGSCRKGRKVAAYQVHAAKRPRRSEADERAAAGALRTCGHWPAQAAYEIKARAVSCRRARSVVRRWGETAAREEGGDGSVLDFYCRYRNTGYEEGLIRCSAPSNRLVRWKTGV